MQLFTDDLRVELEKRYHSIERKPAIYNLAILEHNHKQRIAIEEWLIDVPQEAAKSIVKKLRRDHANTYSTLGELMVGSVFGRKGFKVNYEPKFGLFTPDWSIEDKNGNVSISDVFVLDMPQRDKQEWSRTANIFQLLSRLPFGAVVNVRASSTASATDKLVEGISNWLSSNPEQGASFECEGVYLGIVAWNEMYSTLQPLGPVMSAWGRPDRLIARIREKAEHYRQITDNGTPFLLVAINQNMNLVDEIDAVCGLYGRDVEDHAMYYEERFTTQYCSLDGLFYEVNSNLGGVLWIEGGIEMRKSQLFINKRAVPRLPFSASLLF